MQHVFAQKSAVVWGYGLFLTLFHLSLWAQNGGALKGVVRDKNGAGDPLPGAVINIVGTYKGASANDNGEYNIADIKPGEYTIRFFFEGYTELRMTAIKIKAGETLTLDAALSELTSATETVEILGEKNLIDLESGKSSTILTAKDLKDLSVTDVKSIAAMQAGVNQSPDGLQIRGGRVYETQFYVDGVSAQSKLGGTGFGLDVAKNALGEIEVVTGAADAQYGGATSGMVLTKIQEGGDKINVSGSYARDNLGFNDKTSWNTEMANLAIGGPLIPRIRFGKKDSSAAPPKKNTIHDKLFFFISGDVRLTDEYFRKTANQLYSSLLDDPNATDKSASKFFAPRQTNKWSGTFKLTYKIRPGYKLTLSNMNSLAVSQDSRSLQIVGNETIMRPGFQFQFSENLDNATTFTQRSNLTILNFQALLTHKLTLNFILSRLFVNNRSDANGRPFRDQIINQIYDPASIVTDPVSIYNPDANCDTCTIRVNPGNGLYNNGGISTVWRDQYEQEYTGKLTFGYDLSKVHYFNFGVEHREQEYQWIDVSRPWIGAPIKINDSTTYSSNRIGATNEIWKVRPAEGAIFFEDRIRYRGIIAAVGLRMSYWTAGSFADEAVNDPRSPLPQIIRDEYHQQNTHVFGRSWKARLLPNLRVSFPVTENNVLYFNYAHALRTQHPRFLYTGLDPVYLDQSFLSDLGNPNLNPETSVSFEIGLKSQLSANWALTVTAFNKDQFDFVTRQTIQIRDQTGRFVDKTIALNQDYARSRGLEITLQRRISTWFTGMLSFTYQSVTTKSSTAYESKLAIRSSGRNDASGEHPAAWDRPFFAKGSFVFRSPKNFKPFKIPLQNFIVTFYTTFQSGFRYTPMRSDGIDRESGRERFVPITDKPLSEVGASWFWVDMRLTREFRFSKKSYVGLYFEVKNIFNNKNAQIINPVTGRGYEYGDPLPFDTYRDPKYPHPNQRGDRADDPARYLQPTQLMLGLTFQL